MASDTQAKLDAIALMVGGTAPDSANNPHFYSGYKVGDGSGVAGLKGCYAYPPESLEDVPVALALGGNFTDSMGRPRVVEDMFRLLIVVSRNDPQTQIPLLNSLRDLVENLFASKMELGLPHGDVLYGWLASGQTVLYSSGGVDYPAWEMRVRVPTATLPNYTA